MHCLFLNRCRLLVTLLFLFHSLQITISSDNCAITSRLVPRSQGFDGTMQMINSTAHTHLYDMPSWYVTGSYTPEFTQTFDTRQLARCFLGTSSDVLIQGSQVVKRSSQALLADYFYLPPDYNGTIRVRPIIQNFNNNLDLYIQLNPLLDGFYVRIYAPITYTRWNLNFEERAEKTQASYAAGYFTPGTLLHDSLLTSFGAFVQGVTISQTVGVLDNALVGGGNVEYTGSPVAFEPLAYSRMSPRSFSQVGVPDVRVQVGWDFFCTPDYHAGFNIQGSAPTGAATDFNLELFAPQLGNGHWEAGGGFSGHYTCWYSKDYSKELSCWLTINATHLFTKTERRTFDLKGKPLSRYMPAALHAHDGITDKLEDSQGTNAPYQFKNFIAPIANITTQDVSVSSLAQGEIIFMINLTVDNLSWDFGYNFWGKSAELINPFENNSNVPYKKQQWTVKGNSNLFGYAANNSLTPPVIRINQAVALSASQAGATINFGTNTSTASGTVPLNNGVDSAQHAFAGGTPVPLNSSLVNEQTFFSFDPVLIDQQSVDFGPGIRGISHKIFTCISYNATGTWWAPYIGGGFFVEWGTALPCHFTGEPVLAPNTVAQNRSDTLDCALSQWAVFVKAGFACN